MEENDRVKELEKQVTQLKQTLAVAMIKNSRKVITGWLASDWAQIRRSSKKHDTRRSK